MHLPLSVALCVAIASVLSLHVSASAAATGHLLADGHSAAVFLRANQKHASDRKLATQQIPELGGVVGMPQLQEQPTYEIHTGKRTFWPPDQGNGLVAWLFAALFVIMIALVPCVLHVSAEGWGWPGYTVITEGICLVIWLVTGLVMFTQVFYFSSPHFGDAVRTLTLVEAVYLFAQIITTVGYGDIIPAFLGGQIFVGCFVFCAIMLIATMVSEVSAMIVTRTEERLAKAVEEASKHVRDHDGVAAIGQTKGPSLKPVVVSLLLFILLVLAGMAFYWLYPGEGKTPGQGLYMSIITLTTVGFGAFTAETEAGKVFGAFWMIIGVASLGGFVASFTEFMVSMKDRERDKKEHDAEDVLNEELKDHNGRIDKMRYLQYALLKYNIASKQQVAAILKQYDALDEDNEGSISVSKLNQLSSPVGSPISSHRRTAAGGKFHAADHHDHHH